MGLFGTAAGVIRRAAGAIVAPAEDPRDVAVTSARRHTELLAKVGQARRQVDETYARAVARAKELAAAAESLHGEAVAAVAAGDEPRARGALRRRQVALIEARAVAQQEKEIGDEAARLAEVEAGLVEKIEAFRARQQMILARHSAAEAQVQIAEALSGVSSDLGDLGQVLERAETNAERMESRMAAIQELVATGSLQLLGAPTAGAGPGEAVDGELAAIRAALRPRIAEEDA